MQQNVQAPPTQGSPINPHPDEAACFVAHAIITSISPNTWFAGKTYHITIKGTNLQYGTDPACLPVWVVPMGAHGNISVSQVNWVNTSTITATVMPAATEPTEQVNLAVSCDDCDYWPTQPVQILATPKILWNNKTISGVNPPPTQNAVVGQKVDLTTDPNSLPGGLAFSTSTWTVGGTNIGARPLILPSGQQSSASTKPTVFSNTNLTTYWIYPKSNVPVTYQYCVPASQMGGLSPQDLATGGNCNVTANAAFNVSAPTASITTRTYLPYAYAYWYVTSPLSGCGNNQVLLFGLPEPWDNSCDPARELYGIDFLATGIANVPNGGGEFFFIQLVNNDQSTITSTSGQVHSYPPQTGLDNTYPYSGDEETWDSPLSGLVSEAGWKTESRQFSATMYLMWQSTATNDAIAVPIGYVTWGIQGSANRPTGQNSLWTLNPSGSTTPVYQQSSDVGKDHGMPTWSSLSLNIRPKNNGQ